MCAHRTLIVPWLMEQLDAKLYPGVAWLNPERTRFRVPWKHGSRQSVSTDDFQLFEAWAIASGRFNPRTDKRTPSEWKRNFRSALNRKPEIKMVEDNSTDSEDPHKVFEIQPPTDHGVAGTGSSDASSTQDGSTGAHGDSSSSSQDDTLESVLNSLDISNPEDRLGTDNPLAYGGHPYLDLDTPAVTVSPLQQMLGTSKLETDFEVRAFYRGQLVFSHVFSNVEGLCFVPTGSCGIYPELADVVLPAPSTLVHDQLQVSFTDRILQGLGPGVLLRTEGMALLGTRRGHSHVYWNHSESPEVAMPCGELPKEQFSCLFNLQQFVQELIGYMEKRNGSPNFSLWLCFGEEWPDASRSWKKKLIMVQVIPKTLEILYQLSQAGGASSLGEVEPDLRISDSLQEQEFLAQLKEWEEKMDVQFYG